MHCATCQEVKSTLGDALRREEQQAAQDRQIISDIGVFMAETKTRPDAFYDESVLPHPKDAIIASIEREILRTPRDEVVPWLKSGTLFLWNFQRGVGTAPLPLTGEDASVPTTNLPHPSKVQRAEHFGAVADLEAKQIDQRIASAIRMRSERRL
jgi:hypothetical protein